MEPKIEENHIRYWRNATDWEIKFGEGAIHYIDVHKDEPFLYKKDGTRKKWFIHPSDGIR